RLVRALSTWDTRSGRYNALGFKVIAPAMMTWRRRDRWKLSRQLKKAEGHGFWKSMLRPIRWTIQRIRRAPQPPPASLETFRHLTSMARWGVASSTGYRGP
ncbi:MAG: hypothetical protein ACRDTH_23900, partial [Pseudonocardiaceae bacterium]